MDDTGSQEDEFITSVVSTRTILDSRLPRGSDRAFLGILFGVGDHERWSFTKIGLTRYGEFSYS